MNSEQVQLDIDYQGQWSRLLALVKTLLVLPHYIVLIFLGFGSGVVSFLAWFAVLFTGRYPEGMFNYQVAVARYGARVAAYVFQMVDAYPPFSLDDDPGYPVRLQVEYPPRVGRWRAIPLLTYLLILPVGFAAGLMLFIGFIGVFIAWLCILFTGRYPEGIFGFVSGALRWNVKANLYTIMVNTQYPMTPSA